MEFINFKDNKEIRRDIEPLYISAFPEEERPPVGMFFKTVLLDNDDLLGFYDNNEFIGFANVITYKDICYLFFLAIAEEKRNQGYGSKILQLLKELYKDRVLTLCYEEINDKYPDIDLRIRRKNFYYRNGF